jgi:hypothetical protein
MNNEQRTMNNEQRIMNNDSPFGGWGACSPPLEGAGGGKNKEKQKQI